jgi:hypothetical protein
MIGPRSHRPLDLLLLASLPAIPLLCTHRHFRHLKLHLKAEVRIPPNAVLEVGAVAAALVAELLLC